MVVTVNDNIERFQLILDAKRFSSMDQDGDKLDVIDAHLKARGTRPPLFRGGIAGKFLVLATLRDTEQAR